MQLQNLVKPIEEMTDDELRERLRQVRANRVKERPAAKARVKRETKKGGQGRLKNAEYLLLSLSPEEREALMKELGA